MDPSASFNCELVANASPNTSHVVKRAELYKDSIAAVTAGSGKWAPVNRLIVAVQNCLPKQARFLPKKVCALVFACVLQVSGRTQRSGLARVDCFSTLIVVPWFLCLPSTFRTCASASSRRRA